MSYLLWHMQCFILWPVPTNCCCCELIDLCRVFIDMQMLEGFHCTDCSILYALKLVFPVCVLVCCFLQDNKYQSIRNSSVLHKYFHHIGVHFMQHN